MAQKLNCKMLYRSIMNQCTKLEYGQWQDYIYIKLPEVDDYAVIMEENDCVHRTFTMKYVEVKAHDESAYSQMIHKNM